MKIQKCTKLVCNVYDKEKYVAHLRPLKQTLSHGLEQEEVHKVIEFSQKAQLKPYIDMNTELKKRGKEWFWKRTL